MRINHNIAALNTYRQLSANTTSTSKSLEKLSSGLRINRAGDDAAGLAISEKMRGQIRGLDQAGRNASDGISLIQTAEGALNETHSILQRMKELATQASNGTNTDADRKEIQKEVDQLTRELTRISNDTEFNTQTLLNGGINGANAGEMVFQIGANSGQNISLSISAMDAKSLGVAEDVKSVSAALSGTAGNVQGADMADNQYLAQGAYKLETVANGSNFDVLLKDADNKVVASALNQAAGTGGVVTLTSGGKNVIDISFSGAISAASAANVAIGSSGADLAEAAADNAAGLAAVSMSDPNALAEGTYSITFKDGSTAGTIDEIVITDSAGKELGKLTGGITANTVSDITLDDGGTISVVLGATPPTNGQTSKFTVTQSDYQSGSSTISTFKAQGENKVLDEKASVVKGIDIRTKDNADKAITTIQTAIDTVSAERSKLGAFQNRLEHTINNLGTSAENLSAAESRIRDVDMAKEMVEFTKNNILSQAAQAMLAQANQQPQSVLQLLQ